MFQLKEILGKNFSSPDRSQQKIVNVSIAAWTNEVKIENLFSSQNVIHLQVYT